MKLTEVSVDGYGVCNNLRLQNLDAGLNVVFGRSATGKSTLIRYIRNVLFGFGAQNELGHGALEVGFSGSNYRLLRTAASAGQLVTTDLRGVRGADRNDHLQNELANIGAEAFDSVFVYGKNRDCTDWVRIATNRCGVPLGRHAAFGNSADLAEKEHRKREFELRLSSIDSRIADLENQRQDLNQRIDQLEFSFRGIAHDLDSELESVSQQIQNIDLGGIKAQINSLDDEISVLQSRIEADQQSVAPRPWVEPTGLADLYRRLDEIDDQIRRWRLVHADIQQQRVQLKNEMVVWNETGIESSQHPYYRAQQIVRSIESKVGLAEQSLGALQNVQIVTAENNAMAAERLNELCGGIRQDLYELCDELGDQFKQIRHRAAAAELKRLRRCYEEIGENIRVIVDRRDVVIGQIRELDPEGARLIDHQDQDFCRCAMHDGYLQARRRYAGPVRTLDTASVPTSDWEFEIRRLSELRENRSRVVRELVEGENQISDLEARRSELLLQQQHSFDRRQLEEFKEQFQRLRLELTELQKQREMLVVDLEKLDELQVVEPDRLLESAGARISQLTQGGIQRVWFTESGVVTLDRNEIQRNYEALDSATRYAVGLGVCMAITESMAKRGNRLPMLVDNAFMALPDDQIRAALQTMIQFCSDGNQLIAFTSNHQAAELARRSDVTTLDLPETSVSPDGPGTPVWKPERTDDYPTREPEFLTPFTTRMHPAMHADMTRYPQVKYPPSGIRIDHSAANFDQPRPVEQSVPAASLVKSEIAIDDQITLASIGIFDSMDVERLNRLGLDRVAELLEIDPADLPSDFVDSHISSMQMDKWQALSWLLVCVPGLGPSDARILYAIGVAEPEQLETTNSSQLIERINRFLRSADGQAFATYSKSYDLEIVKQWYDALHRTRSSWRLPSGYSRRSRHSNRGRSARQERRERDYPLQSDGRQNRRSTIGVQRDRDRQSGRRRRDWRPEREARIHDQSNRGEPLRVSGNRGDGHQRERVPALSLKSPGNPTPAAASESLNLKFYLQLSDDLEAAPSIGPKTAERFAKINVRNISEFLTQTAESMATKINYKRITAEVIRQWQNQARLVCRIPNLRGHDAQLLVACGITEPEDLAQRQPQSLFKTIEPFAKSKEGLKIIRGGKQPDLDEVSDWIAWARQTRSLQAA